MNELNSLIRSFKPNDLKSRQNIRYNTCVVFEVTFIGPVFWNDIPCQIDKFVKRTVT